MGIIHDIRDATRSLIKNPALTVAAIVSLGLGIGANMTVYSWASGLLFRPIAGVRDQSDLVLIDGHTRQGTAVRLSYPDFVDLRERVRTLRDTIAFSTHAMNLATDDRVDRVWGQLVTGNFFSFLELQPAAGVFFTREVDRKPGAAPEVVISFDFWHRRFHGDLSMIGREIRINKHSFTVIGVAPKGFYSAYPTLIVDLWIPIMMQAQIAPGSDRLNTRDSFWLLAYGKLTKGVVLGEARAEIETISDQLSRDYPFTNSSHVMKVLAVWDAPGGVAFLRPLITTLSGVATLLLALACANMAGILLVHAIHRRREMSIRTTLGATRSRIVRQLLLESLILAMSSGVVGTLLGYWAAGLLIAFFPPSGLPGGFHVVVDWRWAVFAFGLTVLTSFAFGLVPALQVSNANLAGALKEESGATTGTSRRARLRSTLIVAQIAISFVLLVGAGLFLMTLNRAGRSEVGFNPKGVLLASVDVFASGYSMESGRSFFRELIGHIENTSGVRVATFARRIALNVGAQFRSIVFIDGYVPSSNEDVMMTLNYVGPRYLEALEIPLVAGRDFSSHDREGAADVGIVNQTAARRYWRSNPVGQKLRLGDRSITIVGVAADSKYDNLAEPPVPYLYVSALQFYQPSLVLHVRSDGDPAAFASTLRRIVREIDPTVALFDVRTMEEHMAVSTFLYRLAATCLSVVGAIAIVLAGGGLFSMTSYNVNRRTSEIGLRMALGADRRQIVKLVLRQTVLLTVTGVVIGLALLVTLTPLLGDLLLGVRPTNPVLLFGTGTILVLVSAVACFVPVRRAVSVDPATCLRNQ